jgi:hypothetical protein
MVLEHLFPHEWLESKAEMAFFLGWGYSIIAIVIASLVFPRDPSLVAIGLTTIMLLPSMRKIITLKRISIEEILLEKALHQEQGPDKDIHFPVTWDIPSLLNSCYYSPVLPG